MRAAKARKLVMGTVVEIRRGEQAYFSLERRWVAFLSTNSI
jgi:hypothetical protein